jgi:hypothetical protein
MEVSNLEPVRVQTRPVSAQSLGSEPVFTLSREDDTGMMRIVGVGRWTMTACDRHFAAVERMVLETRRRGDPIRVLVDLRRSTEQDESTTERIGYWIRHIYRAEDRIAMLVESSLLKAQMRRRSGAGEQAMFVSEAAARTWLFAGDG